MDTVYRLRLAKKLKSIVCVYKVLYVYINFEVDRSKFYLKIYFTNIITVAPQIQPSGITLALLGDRVELKCLVKSKPPPKVIFWRDHEGREPVPLGSNYEMTTDASSAVCNHVFDWNMLFIFKRCIFVGPQPNHDDSYYSSANQ